MKTRTQVKEELFVYQAKLNNITTDLLSHQATLRQLTDFVTSELHMCPDYNHIKEDLQAVNDLVYNISTNAVLYRISNIKHNLNKIIETLILPVTPKSIRVRTVEEVRAEYFALKNRYPDPTEEESVLLNDANSLVKLHEEYYSVNTELTFHRVLSNKYDQFNYRTLTNRFKELEAFLNTNQD